MAFSRWRTFACAAVVSVACVSVPVEAATVYVASGGDLQRALDNARPGDTVLLAENAEFVGNFVLPVKAGDQWITVRTSAPDSVLPEAGVRVQPAHAALLARLRSPNASPALQTAPGAHHWHLRYLEFPGNAGGLNDIVQIGDGSTAQNSLALVPHHIVLDHVYVHGSTLIGQKRGIALNASSVTIRDSYVSECKGIGQDTQAIGGWNGPGPYVIENNYLEAAGENILIGGADPAIANLVADGVTVRRNLFSRPMSWRNPIVAAPAGVSAASEAGGALPAGTYAYRVVARRTVQVTVARSTASPEVSVVTTAAGSVRIRWQASPGVTDYVVYGRTPGGSTMNWTVTGTEFVDVGTAGTSGAAPTATGTVWSVKNIFELKNARNVIVEENIFENHWKESQPGYAIVLTPRNSQGSCTWCVVEHVRFERNVFRNMAAAINLLGYDGGHPSRQAADITFRQNLFTGLSTSLGGNGWFMQIGDGPRDIVIEHNTIDSNGNAVIYAYGGSSSDPREIYGLRFDSNAARHGAYGINGQYFAFGNGILNAYFPDRVFRANYLAGGSSSRLPAGTLIVNPFQDQFVSIADGDYSVRDTSVLKRAAADGTDIGVDFDVLRSAIAGVDKGMPPPSRGDIPVPPAPDFTAACTYLQCTFTDASIPGTSPIASHTWTFGDGGSPADGAAATHQFTAAGTYTVTLTVTDAKGVSAPAQKSVSVDAPVPPTAALTVSCTELSCAFADASTAGTGAITSRSWAFGDGSAIDNGPVSGVHAYALAGTYTVTVVVRDANGLSGAASTTVTVEPPNLAPMAGFSASCVDLTCAFTDSSVDSDGRIVAWHWAFGAGTSSAAAPSFKFAAPGSYPVALTVTDDDGATHAKTLTVDVVGRMHVGYSGSTLKWSSASGSTQYWSATVNVVLHGLDERPISGATVVAAWSGALVKTVSCVTDAAGTCVLKSGTLSYGRSSVTLAVTAATLTRNVYDSAKSHDQAGNRVPSLTLIRP